MESSINLNSGNSTKLGRGRRCSVMKRMNISSWPPHSTYPNLHGGQQYLQSLCCSKASSESSQAIRSLCRSIPLHWLPCKIAFPEEHWGVMPSVDSKGCDITQPHENIMSILRTLFRILFITPQCVELAARKLRANQWSTWIWVEDPRLYFIHKPHSLFFLTFLTLCPFALILPPPLK